MTENKKYIDFSPFDLLVYYHYEQDMAEKKLIANVLLKKLLDKLNELKPFNEEIYAAYEKNLLKFENYIIDWAVKYKKGLWDEFTVLRFAEYILDNGYHKYHFEVNPDETWYALMQIFYQLPVSVEKDFVTYEDIHRRKRDMDYEARIKNEPKKSIEEIKAIFERQQRNLPPPKKCWFEDLL